MAALRHVNRLWQKSNLRVGQERVLVKPSCPWTPKPGKMKVLIILIPQNMGVNPKIGGTPPKWMVKIMENRNPMNKWDDLGGKKTPIFGSIPIWLINPSLPKSSKYLVNRCLEPLNVFSGAVWGSKHLLTRYLED